MCEGKWKKRKPASPLFFHLPRSPDSLRDEKKKGESSGLVQAQEGTINTILL